MSVYAALHAPIIPVLRLLLQQTQLPAGARVLDLACGGGEKLPLLAEAWVSASFTALDLDQAALRHAQPNAHALVAGDAHNLPFCDEVFDVVVCIAALGLFANPLAALREVRRVLRPTGQAVVVTAEQRWAQIVGWSPSLGQQLSTLPPAHPDHAEHTAALAHAAGFAGATVYAVPLGLPHAPVAAALSLLDWARVAPLAAALPNEQQLMCQTAHANAEIELCDMCLALWATKA